MFPICISLQNWVLLNHDCVLPAKIQTLADSGQILECVGTLNIVLLSIGFNLDLSGSGHGFLAGSLGTTACILINLDNSFSSWGHDLNH